ncbi:MAG: Cell division protein ZapA [Syntrophorhabdaceae bacterium PtaU1.Bin034]|nr:MAG: Cell division protein ZapA [Syntrophorhabdaceae bacterium PtaU1.Bin034]
MGKVEVTILNQSFTFVGEDEQRIRRVAGFVDDEIRAASRNFGIVNTLNAVIMAMMKVADDYITMRERFEKVEDKTLRLLRKVEDVENPCGVRDKW